MGPEVGPFAVVRNAGGRAIDSMRSLAVLNAINPLGLVVVVHHTGNQHSVTVFESSTNHQCADCGTTHVKDAEVRQSIRDLGSSASVDSMDFGEINE